MKKVLSIVAFAAVLLFAGKANAQNQITIHAGYQDASVKVSTDYYDATENYKGFYAGATYDYDLGMAGIFLTPGAELSYCTFDREGDGLDQLDLRIRLWGRWLYPLTDNIKIGAFAGPSVNIGIAGKMYDDEMEISKIDVGLTFGGELKFNSFGLELGYNLGLLNRNASEYDGSIKFSTFFVGLNYTI